MIKMGIVNIYKEKGYTSHDAAAVMRKIFKTKKVGHTGTLDPAAEGVLPMCIGRATKLASLLTAEDKTYVAEVVLGIVTETGDLTGKVVNRCSVLFDAKKIACAVQAFEGVYAQIPPMYSAIKINGQKLYELARKGITVEREARPVRIDRIEIIKYKPEENTFTMEVQCSKGTYIRSLCTDIGERLGFGACMGDLLRTRSGIFHVAESVTLDTLKNATEDRLPGYICPVEKALPFDRADLRPEGIKLAENGNPIPLKYVMGENLLPMADNGPLKEEQRVWLYNGSRLIGLFKQSTRLTAWVPEVMLL